MRAKNITIFGANGRVGRLIVEKALLEGHHVTAFVHHKHHFNDNKQLHVIEGDVYNPADLDKALAGADVVVSALGSWRTPDKDVLSFGMTNIIPIMKKNKISRIISLTGAEARAKSDQRGLVHDVAHMLLSIIAGKVLKDGEEHIQLLESSGLDWVVIRSPIMKESTSITYSLTNIRPFPWETVSRAAVAHAMLREAVDDNISQQAAFIH